MAKNLYSNSVVGVCGGKSVVTGPMERLKAGVRGVEDEEGGVYTEILERVNSCGVAGEDGVGAAA